MSVKLHIGPEENLHPELPQASKHVLNLRNIDQAERSAAHENVSLDLKEEIKSNNKKPGRICILAQLPDHRRGLSRIPMVAAALLIIMVLNLGQLIFRGQEQGGETLALAGEAFLSLQGAGQSVLSGEEGSDLLLFEDAEKLFEEARTKGAFLLESESDWLASPNEVSSFKNLLDAGTLMAEVGQHLSKARTALNNFPEAGSLTEYLRLVSETELEPAALQVHEITTLLASVDLSGTPYAEQFSGFQEKLSALSSLFDLWVSSKEPLLTALGDRYPQTYLVLLENNDEMRMGGGFMGSMALVTMNDGRVTDLSFHDVYEYDGNYFTHQEVPVHELKGLTSEWRLRDSNTSPDFPTSAKQAMWFLEEEGGPGVDGVIAINLSSAQAFLEDTGPVKVSSLGKEISAATFPAVMSTLIEAKVNKTDPKAILGEFINAFTAKLSDSKTQTAVALTTLEEAHKKQILFYSKDPSVQALITSMGMSGALPTLSTIGHDFFMPVFTNIGANKTDRYMETALQHDTQIFDDGTMVSSVTMTRTHTFNAATLSWLKSTLADYGFTAWNSGLEQTLGNDVNHSGIRLYVPEGATILGTEGVLRDEIQFYYDPDQDISYYYIDQIVAPDSSKTFTINFALPWNFNGDFQQYDFDLFKQPGLKGVTFEKTVSAPNMMLSGYPLATIVKDGLDYVLSGPLNRDTHVTLLYR